MIELNKEAYSKLIEKDVAFLYAFAKSSITRTHIKAVLIDSIDLLYPPPNKVDSLVKSELGYECPNCGFAYTLKADAIRLLPVITKY